jgi:membrane protein YdbS with pleckstrin-like domain
VLGATLVGALWLYTYRATVVVEYIDPMGHHFHPSERVREQPWWSVPATVALVLIGAAILVWILPQWGRPLRRFANRIAKPS